MDFDKIRSYFPQTHQKMVYLDSASTTLKLKPVIDRVNQFYQKEVSNVHRGNSQLVSQVTQNYEHVRELVAQFISASCSKEIIFVRGVTEGVNFLAFALESFLKEGSEITLTQMEHHSNYLPWVRWAQKKKLKINLIPVTPEGELDLSQLEKYITPQTRLVSMIHQSNALGTVNDIKKIIQKAQEVGAFTVVDAAQSISTMKINVQDLNCDFLLFSGHKLFAPSGAGVLYGKKDLLENLPPYQLGGGMVSQNSLKTWALLPHCFEAGTPAIESILGLGASLQLILKEFDFDEIQKYEKELLLQAETTLQQFSEVQIIGTSPSRINTLSFVVQNVHCEDLGQLIGEQNVSVRVGHHCCQPLMDALKLKSGTVRVSFSVYNRKSDVDALFKSVQKTLSILTG